MANSSPGQQPGMTNLTSLVPMPAVGQLPTMGYPNKRRIVVPNSGTDPAMVAPAVSYEQLLTMVRQLAQELQCARRQEEISLQERNAAVQKLVQEEESWRKREESLLQERSSLQLRIAQQEETRKQKEESLLQDCNGLGRQIAQEKEAQRKTQEALVRQIAQEKEAQRKTQEALVRQIAQEKETQRKNQEALMQECRKVGKERDSWSGMCSRAIASMRSMEKEMETEKRALEQERKKFDARVAQVQSESGKQVQAQELLVLQRDSEALDLKLRIKELEKGKEEYLAEKQHQEDTASALDALKRKLDVKASTISSLQLEIIHVEPVATSGTHDDEKKVSHLSFMKDHPREQDAHVFSSDNIKAKGAGETKDELLDLELVTEAVMKKIDSVQSIMAEVSKLWQKPSTKRTPASLVAKGVLKVDKEEKIQRFDTCGGACGDMISVLVHRVKMLQDKLDASCINLKSFQDKLVQKREDNNHKLLPQEVDASPVLEDGSCVGELFGGFCTEKTDAMQARGPLLANAKSQKVGEFPTQKRDPAQGRKSGLTNPKKLLKVHKESGEILKEGIDRKIGVKTPKLRKVHDVCGRCPTGGNDAVQAKTPLSANTHTRK